MFFTTSYPSTQSESSYFTLSMYAAGAFFCLPFLIKFVHRKSLKHLVKNELKQIELSENSLADKNVELIWVLSGRCNLNGFFLPDDKALWRQIIKNQKNLSDEKEDYFELTSEEKTLLFDDNPTRQAKALSLRQTLASKLTIETSNTIAKELNIDHFDTLERFILGVKIALKQALKQTDHTKLTSLSESDISTYCPTILFNGTQEQNDALKAMLENPNNCQNYFLFNLPEILKQRYPDLSSLIKTITVAKFAELLKAKIEIASLNTYGAHTKGQFECLQNLTALRTKRTAVVTSVYHLPRTLRLAEEFNDINICGFAGVGNRAGHEANLNGEVKRIIDYSTRFSLPVNAKHNEATGFLNNCAYYAANATTTMFRHFPQVVKEKISQVEQAASLCFQYSIPTSK